MIETIIQRVLQITGNAHLVPYVRGLQQLGRPGDVSFPKELMGQGAAIVLSGLNNTMAFQSNPDWIGPYWYERQRDPSSDGFVPTGMNLVTANISFRNWTAIGALGSEREAMVDPVGMVTMGEQGWSFFPTLKSKGKLWLPPRMTPLQVQQRMQDGSWPVVETRYLVDPRLYWQSDCEVVICGNDELVIYTQELENRSQEVFQGTLGISLRPYNPLSISHIHRIKYQDHLWRINRRAAMWMLDEPDRVQCGDRNQTDPIFLCGGEDVRTKQSSRSGVAAGMAEWDVSLQPWERKRFVVVGILGKCFSEPMPLYSRPIWADLTEAREINREQGRKLAERGAQIRIPNTQWMDAWKNLRQRLFVFDDGDHFSPGTMLYHHFWIRDNAFLSMAHTVLGFHAAVDPKMPRLKSSQKSSGYFCSQDGEWDSNGQAIHTMVDHVIATGDRSLLQKLWPSIHKGALWIELQCHNTQSSDSPHRGLLPSGFSAEHFGPNDHYFWDAWWSLRGLLDAIWAADVVGDHDAKLRLEHAARQLHRDLNAATQYAFQRQESRGLPSSPYRKVDCSAVGNLVAVAPLDLVGPNAYWLRPTLERLWTDSMWQGMFFQKIVHTGLNAYLSIQVARAFLACGDDRWVSILQAVLDHASPTWTWPEAIHPRTGGGCMGDGDHGWAVAEVLSFLASVLVRVQDGEILLGHGVPKTWYNANMNLEVHGVVTRHGVISWRMRGRGECAEFTWNVERNQFQKALPLSLALPVPLGLEHPKLTANRHDRKILHLSQDSGSIVIPLQRNSHEAATA